MIFSDFKKPCKNVGGVLKTFIQNACDVSQNVEQQLSFVKEENFIVPSEFAEYEFTRNSAVLTETEQNNRNGKLVNYKLTFDIAKATLQNEIEINKLRKSDKVIVIVQDHNRIFRVIGSKCNPATVKVAYNSGKSYANENIYTIEIESAEIQKPFRLPLPIDPPRPKTNLTVKNSGAKIGFVKVEWETNIKYVAPETQESYYVNPSVDVKVTWGVVDLDNGLLDANLINISYPNYVLPSRIDEAYFDGVVETGDLVPAIPDENTIKKARSFTFIMPNTDYLAEVKFREIQYKDIDFENPICTDNITNGSAITTMRDTQNLVSYVQATPSQRALFTNNAAVFEGDARSYLVQNTSLPIRNYFFVGSVKRFSTPYPYFTPYSRNLDLALPLAHVTSFGSPSQNMILGTSRSDGKFGLYGLLGTNASSGRPIPDFDFDSSFIDENVMMNTHAEFSTSWGARNQLFAKGLVYDYPNDRAVVETSFKIGDRQRDGKASVLRALGTEALTADENEIINNKMRAKYNA